MAHPFFGHLSGGPILGLIAGCPEGDRFETLRTCSALCTLDRLAICIPKSTPAGYWFRPKVLTTGNRPVPVFHKRLR
jgi:hypothetical protein